MSKLSKKLLYLSGISTLLLAGWIAWHLPDRSPLTGHTADWDLTQYLFPEQITRITGIASNLSGLTYHAPSGMLYAITNKPREVHILNTQGQLQRSIALSGFRDTESIDHIRDNLFVIAEEQRYNLVLINIDAETDTLHRDQGQVLNIADEDKRNVGIEGVVWLDAYGLLAALEKPPQIVLQPLPENGVEVQPTTLSNIRLNVRDFAGLSSLPGEPDTLLVLSESSDSLHIVDLQGRELSRLSLRRDDLGLRGWMRQPEGVAVDNEGNIYLVGEPNQFMKLQRPLSTH